MNYIYYGLNIMFIIIIIIMFLNYMFEYVIYCGLNIMNAEETEASSLTHDAPLWMWAFYSILGSRLSKNKCLHFLCQNFFH